MNAGRFSPEAVRLDDAARAGWLYYVAGNTQDEIARKLGVSRQSAQRLVAMAVSEKLIKVRVDHPIARCMDLAEALADRFGLASCEVVPSDPDAPDLLTGIAIAAAVELERVLKSPERRVVSLGTGRALKATVEQLPRMACPQHVVVSRLGNMMQDGSASPYNATISLAERIGAPHYPYPLPVLARDPAELAAMRGQDAVRNTIRLSKQADLSLVGIGQMDRSAPLFVDGFVSRAEMDELAALGAVGEITSWVYDRGGQVIDCAFNARVASAPLPRASQRPVIAVATGEAKVPAIRAALVGRLVNGLVTSEATAERLLAD
ncbi:MULTISPECIES: sugar-binding transcriptional regulator [Paracoccus]|uniref:Sugar-binding transcriptional regulator n=1 Tax=Paracoccus aerius TaxID=1915382 RepID=A0ABS1S4U9_9RHOB|nr:MULTISPECIES: sugar-binding transcriptional regulator [Paracoccus]MBL3673730.1 sugar-binding transcriptional regulator [Paracoccus aerius]QIR84529.1 sugar-binding transcriptional regulator [Paracoccus sp. AK26]GHG22893.1 DNA-binding transcriptional regulator [Paracoccus aerius]